MTALARVPSFTISEIASRNLSEFGVTLASWRKQKLAFDDCSEGLVDLVGKRCGRFSHRHHAGHAGELLLCLTQLLFGSSLLRHVNTRANITGKRPLRIEWWHPDVENPLKLAPLVMANLLCFGTKG
jgi:hypothetical protein